MKKCRNDESDLVKKLYDNVNRYRKIDKGCYKTCNEILKDEIVDIDELYHAKAVLQQNIERESKRNELVSQFFSVIAIFFAALSFLVSVSGGGGEILISGLLVIVVIIVCTIIYCRNDSSTEKYTYYVYLLICNEIENRSNESVKLSKKIHGKNKNKKGKNKCQNK